jgi:DNA-binding transcriptional ArsR family regulator
MPIQEAYKALADPTRRGILKYLRSGERSAGDLAAHAGISRTALAHHLTVLKLADLVRVERRGQFQIYSLNTTVFQDVMTEVLDLFGSTTIPGLPLDDGKTPEGSSSTFSEKEEEKDGSAK